MFPDEWPIGREGRTARSQALQLCRFCPVRLECGQEAVRRLDAGQILYGVHCGVVFTDVTPSRQARDVKRLRSVVAAL
jgi:hypothetical protein